MPKKIRVYELAKELGLTNKEGLELALSLGIGVKSHSSSIEDAQADRVRRKADADGLRRPVQPEEPAPAKKAAKATTAAEAAPAAARARYRRGPRVVRAGQEGGRIEQFGRRHRPGQDGAAPPGGGSGGLRPDFGRSGPGGSGSFVSPDQFAADRAAGRPHRPHRRHPGPPRRLHRRHPGRAAPTTRAPAAPATGAPSAPAASAPGCRTRGAPSVGPRRLSARTVRARTGGAGRPGAAAGTPLSRRQRPLRHRRSGRLGPRSAPRASRCPHRLVDAPRSVRAGDPFRPHPAWVAGRPTAPPSGQRPGGGSYPQRTGGRPAPGAGRPAGGPGGGSGGFAGRSGGGFAGRPGGGAPTGAPPPGGRGGMPGRRPPQRRARRRRRNLEELEPTQMTTYQPSTAPVPEGEVIIERGSTARDLGPKLNRSAGTSCASSFSRARW